MSNPEGTGEIHVGTASWTDKTLFASCKFYPRGCSTADARLRHYASQFSMVEVNSSYYAMPSERNSQLWAERTPPEFVLNMKTFRIFTGRRRLVAQGHPADDGSPLRAQPKLLLP